MPVLSSARPIREVTFMGRDRLSARRRALRLLVPALLLAVAVMAPGALPLAAQAATPTHGTIDGTSPVQWNFAPVGGPAGATDSYKLTVKLPSAASTYYAPNVRQGSAHAAVLHITLTWKGNDTTQTLFLSATDPRGNSVGNSTGSTNNDGSDVTVFQLQDPLNVTYTITASNFDGNTPTAVA